MRRAVATSVAGLILLAGCASDTPSASQTPRPTGSCETPAATLTVLPSFPASFPTPGQVAYTYVEQAGPSTIVEGYWRGDLSEAFQGYRDGFEAAGYTVTRDEQEADDAEVNFAGGQTTGEVRLNEECEGLTLIKITIRPE